MILPFKTKINGKPTYFVEKIWAGLENHCVDSFYHEGKTSGKYDFEDNWSFAPKIHTIREDKTNRWQVGKMIDFYINNRTKKAFCFAPRVPVIATQEIFMTHRAGVLEITVANSDSYIGGNDFYLDRDEISKLSRNDGFDTIEEFSKYFVSVINENGDKTGNYWFKGKIIHWTDSFKK